MTDINQWRRMIQPSRARTPAWDGDESEGFLSPATPRRAALKPKPSSHFNLHMVSNHPSKIGPPFAGDLFSPEPPSWLPAAPVPDADSLIESVMYRLLADPSKNLDSSFNSVLLQVFECFRNLKDENERLQASLDQEMVKTGTLELAMRQSVEAWERERLQYKAEVKRLELILAKGERGLAEVTLARQESVLRRGKRGEDGEDRTLETIFELLERSRRYEERLFNHQRATMRNRPASPSIAMRRLSKHLIKHAPATTVHKGLNRMPEKVATLAGQQGHSAPPVKDEKAEHINKETSREMPEAETVCSDTSFSTSSCEGDFLPDDDFEITSGQFTGTENAFPEGQQHDSDADIFVPSQPFNNRPSEGHDLIDGRLFSRPSCAAHNFQSNGGGLIKHPTLKAKASEFFSKWRTPLRIDTSSASVRRFSFEHGDDADATLSAPPLEGLTASVKDRLLRKSASTSFLFDVSNVESTAIQPALSPIVQSPTTSISRLEARKPSRIPTPVHSAAFGARPQPERESSASSLLTAIKCSDEESIRSTSYSNSARSSPTVNHVHSTRSAQGTEDTTRGTSRLEESASGGGTPIEGTNALRGNAFATAAAKAASAASATANATMNVTQQTKGPRIRSRSSNRSSLSRTFQASCIRAQNGGSQIENEHPIMPGL